MIQFLCILVGILMALQKYQNNKKVNRKSQRKSSKKLLAFMIILIVIIISGILELTHTIHLFHKTDPAIIPITAGKSVKAPTTTSNTKVTTPATANSTDQSTTSTSDQATKSQSTSLNSTGSSSSATLATPYGDFVSNHTPGQNDSPTQETSTCDTTPGATCYIKFINSSTGTVSQLPTQTVTSNGFTSWTWNSSILSSGSWEVSAVAILNGQTLTAKDPTMLVIQ